MSGKLRQALLPAAVLGGLAAIMAVGAHIHSKRQLAKPQPLQPIPAIADAQPGRLLIIGDSRVAQWPKAKLPADGTTAGFPGAAAVSIAEVAPAIYAAARPRQVVIQAGFNDTSAAAFAWGEDREAIVAAAARAVARMAGSARAAGAEQVVVMTVAPAIRPDLPRRLLYGRRQDAAIAALNGQLRKLTAEGISVLDVEPLLRSGGTGFDPAYRTDAVHWSPAAYDRLSGALRTMLDTGRREAPRS